MQICSNEIERAQDSKSWLVSPFIDLAFICGGFLWLLFGLHAFALCQTENLHQLKFLENISIIGVLFVAEAHTISTFFLVGESDNARADIGAPLNRLLPFSGHSSWFVPALLFLLVFALSGLCLQFVVVPAVLAKIYLLLVPQHFIAKSRGIYLLYRLRADSLCAGFRRWFLFFTTRIVMFYWIAVLLSHWSSPSPVFLFQKLPDWSVLPDVVPAVLYLLSLGSCLLLSAIMVADFVAGPGRASWPGSLQLISGLFLFLIPEPFLGELWLYAPAYFHGSQYLCLVYSRTRNTREFLSFVFWPLALALSVIVFAGFPLLMQSLGLAAGAASGAAVAVVFCLAQFAHIVADARIWKLRKSAVRAALS
ncbi:MAG: hypothetical protein HY986_16840 [Candidatus Melainabacteria bacterium]|nr:hypothetical protein [Candidatus Melainabacteria bacterium]